MLPYWYPIQVAINSDIFQNMKHEAMAENEKLNTQIMEAKLTLAAEKSRLETEGLFKKDFDLQKTKVEVEAAIQAAHTVTNLAEVERQQIAEERKKLHQERSQFETVERNLKNREIELTSMLQMCDRKKEEAAQMLQESKLLEMKYNEQHKSMQNQLSSLRIREKKLAEDKVNLTRERFSKERQCISCGSAASLPEYREKAMAETEGSSFLRVSVLVFSI